MPKISSIFLMELFYIIFTIKRKSNKINAIYLIMYLL